MPSRTAGALILLAACAAPLAEPTPRADHVVVLADDLTRLDVDRRRVDLAALVETGRATRVGRSVVAAPELWLPPDAAPASLAVSLPAGLTITAPWPRRADGAFELDETALSWRSFVAFGRMETHAIDVGGAALEVAVLDRPHAATWPGIERWLRAAADAQTKLWGEFPVRRAQVVVRLVASEKAVAFGETLRGGAPATVLCLADDATDDALAGDWIATHEFVHLGMPAMPDADAWMSEGFVVYATAELTGGRRSLLPAFERERRTGFARTFAEESASMETSHLHDRVYDAGAAVAWALDDALRREGRTFDEAMREIRRAFGGAKRLVSADEIAARLDAWLGRPLFSETTRAALASRAFPWPPHE